MRSENTEKIATNAAKLLKFEALNVKSMSLRTTAVADLEPIHDIRDFMHAQTALRTVFNTRSYPILVDNSIYLDRTAIVVKDRIRSKSATTRQQTVLYSSSLVEIIVMGKCDILSTSVGQCCS